MINFLRNIVLLFLFIFIFIIGNCQNNENIQPAIAIKDTTNSYLIFPIIYSTPETNWAFGAAGTYFFKINKNDTAQRSSSIRGMGVYTLNDQIIFEYGTTCFFKNENYILKVIGSYLNYPDKYFGTGNNVNDDKYEYYTYQQVEAYPRLLRRILNKFFIGFQYRYSNMLNVKYKQNGLLDNDNILGKNGGVSSGIGLLFDYDNRDNIFNAYKGNYLDISYMYYDKVFGSNFDYKFFIFDYRKFWSFYKLNVLAFQFYTNINFGQPPFRELAMMGGNSLMRGIYTGMYMDRKYLASQIELRTPIWKRFGLVTFLGCGEIGSRFKDFDYSLAKYSYGAGLRFAIVKKERINLRIDYGVSNSSDGWYITVTEAF